MLNVKENVMKVVKGDGKNEAVLKVPAAPAHLDDVAKKEYTRMGNILAKDNRLKPYMLGTLEIWAEGYSTWVWATTAIKQKNAEDIGSGYVQYFKNGTNNITGEMTVKREAVKQMLQCSKIFGLDPASDKALKSADPAQTNLFKDIMKAL